jgi:biotin carboxyl carrier protein
VIVHLEIGGVTHQVEVTAAGSEGSFIVRIGDRELNADARLLQPGLLSLLIDGISYRCVLDTEQDESVLTMEGRPLAYQINDPRSLRARRSRAHAAHGSHPLKASMPGRVVRLLVESGDTVEAQQPILVIEAMKMLNELRTPKPGRVTELRVGPGDTVASGQVLAIIID